MKCSIPEISWHNREPVLSVDIHPLHEKFYRLASGGADCHVLIWQMIVNDNGAVKLEALSDLTRHQKAINSVRWSPTGQYLATADDDANIIIWQLKTDNIPLLEGETNDKEVWVVNKILRGHKEDIYDLCWSPDSLKLLTGSIDNTAILWDFTKGKNDCIITDHKGFVQGVAWDPKGRFIATISTDRICRIIEPSGRHVKARIQKGYLSVPEGHYLHQKEVKYFHDDTFKSFFRRLAFSPDGSLLVVPSGHIEAEGVKKILNATYIFAVNTWTEPVAVLPSSKQCTTVVRFCPMLFELHDEGPDALISLPYRMIFAVGTDHDIVLYDTQQSAPFAHFHQIHYTRLTDLTWSSDGLLLIASSTDGFCALITFDQEELGVKYIKKDCEEMEDSVLDVSGCELLDKESCRSVDATIAIKEKKIPQETKPKKPNLLEQWTIRSPKQLKFVMKEKTESSVQCIEIPGDNKSEVKKFEIENKCNADVKKIVRKRITPVPVVVHNSKPKCDEKIFLPPSVLSVGVKRKLDDSDSIKKSPKDTALLRFLKGHSLSPKVKGLSSIPVEVILDEIEARDAWKCGKGESSSNIVTKIHDDNTDCTSLSLIMEESNPQSAAIGSNCENSEIKYEKSGDKDKLKNEKDSVLTDEVQCSGQEVNVSNINNENKEIVSTEKSTETKGLPQQNDNKINLPKRRIPLITLSSPKNKKK